MYLIDPRYNTLDLTVVLCTFIISAVALDGAGGILEAFALFTVLRAVRVIRIVRIFTEKQVIFLFLLLRLMETFSEPGDRRPPVDLTKQAKVGQFAVVITWCVRYQQDGFDLDLTYVTNRVIATSFPSTGLWSLYR